MLKVKSGLFLLKLYMQIHCMIGRKVKFTSNDQNINCFLENLKIFSLERMRNFSCLSETRRNPISTKKTNKMLRSVSEVFVLAVCGLPLLYLFLPHALQELRNIANEKENYNFIHEKAATNIQWLQTLRAFSFFSIL